MKKFLKKIPVSVESLGNISFLNYLKIVYPRSVDGMDTYVMMDGLPWSLRYLMSKLHKGEAIPRTSNKSEEPIAIYYPKNEN